MSVAPYGQPTDQHLHGLLQLTHALHGLGVIIHFTDLATEAVGEWHSHNQTALIRADAHPGNQAWFLGQLLAFLTAGPAGSPAAHQLRSLRLVPDPRPATD